MATISALTVLATVGATDGPTLAVLAGVHGDEYEGIRAIPQVFRAIDPAELRGRLIMVPVCNVPAFRTATRSSPIDGLNLARVFPGDPQGTVTQRIAHVLTERVIGPSQLLIDLHSAGVAYSMPHAGRLPLRRYAAGAGRARGGHGLRLRCAVGPPARPDRDRALDLGGRAAGHPWIYTEAAGGGRALPEDVACYANGVLNVMRHMGMLPGQPEAQPPRYHLLGSGNTDTPIRVESSGYFVADVAMLDAVTAGQTVGRVLDLAGGDDRGDPCPRRRASRYAARPADHPRRRGRESY